jgi:Fe-S cluster assembly protein SufD
MTATETQTPAQAAVSAYLAEFPRFEAALPAEPPALRALRRQALARFAELGFPTAQQEEWRQTHLTSLAQQRFVAPASDPEALAPEQIAPYTFPAAAQLVFVDGRLSRRLSTLEVENLPPGAFVGGLSEALARAPELVEPYLGRFARLDNPFAALNTAYLGDGAFVYLPRGADLGGPVHLLFLSSSENGQPTRSFPRNLVVTGEGSRLSLVETYAGTGTYFCCPVTELVAGPNSVVDHYKVQRESRDSFHIATFQVYGERSSVPSSHSISLGGGLVRNDVNAVLDGEGIDCILNGLYLVEGRQHVDNHMRVEHAKPHCASHELYKGILDGKARAVFSGLIHVHKGAQKTDAKQSNRNLLLSRDAIANSNPQLEIYADDVKCTHGSTVGQLDDDAVFYLRSRGIGEDAARSLLTYAFASDIVERIKVEPVRKDLEEFLFARLPKGEVVRQAV